MFACGTEVSAAIARASRVKRSEKASAATFDGDVPIQPRFVRAVHLPHPARPDERGDRLGLQCAAPMTVWR